MVMISAKPIDPPFNVTDRFGDYTTVNMTLMLLRQIVINRDNKDKFVIRYDTHNFMQD